MSCRQLSKAGKGHRGGDSTDRFSALDDSTIHFILSFLDTKCAVQTSVLSRRWRFLWQFVPALDLDIYSFSGSYERFSGFVDKVLSLRDPDVTVANISYHGSCIEDNAFVDDPLIARVLEHAASHGTRHLAVNLYRDGDECNDDYTFPESRGSTFGHNLQVLELSGFVIGDGFQSLGFGLLTKLKLSVCVFRDDQDPFSKFPCLRNLILDFFNHDEDHERLRISGPELRTLELLYINAKGFQISAPKLEFFRLYEAENSLRFSGLDLPSLHHADVDFREQLVDYITKEDWIFMFQGFRNVKSLTLCYITVEALCEISEFLEQQLSPFSRLENLNLKWSIDKIDYKVVNYFLKGSSYANPRIKILG